MSRHNRKIQSRMASHRQRGIVLFIALIALVTIMLAAVALVRSVDTSSLIAGNIAFRRAATSSADGGLERAITWLSTSQIADRSKNPDTDITHVLNVTNRARGYYSSLDPAAPNLRADATWTDANSSAATTDASGNQVRYIIQRMCRTAGQVPPAANCVFSDAISDNNSKGNLTPEKSTSSAMYRVTVRVTGPRNTVSYIQGFIY